MTITLKDLKDINDKIIPTLNTDTREKYSRRLESVNGRLDTYPTFLTYLQREHFVNAPKDDMAWYERQGARASMNGLYLAHPKKGLVPNITEAEVIQSLYQAFVDAGLITAFLGYLSNPDNKENRAEITEVVSDMLQKYKYPATADDLAYAIKIGSHVLVLQLLSRGADVHVSSSIYKQPALSCAVNYSDARMVRILLAHTNPPSAKEVYDAMQNAIRSNKNDIFFLLIQYDNDRKGKDSNYKSEKQNTALSEKAISNGNLQIVNALLEDKEKPDVNALYGDERDTPLILAAKTTSSDMTAENRLAIVKTLLKNGARPETKNFGYDGRNRTAYQYALEGDRAETAQLLFCVTAVKFNEEPPENLPYLSPEQVCDCFLGWVDEQQAQDSNATRALKIKMLADAIQVTPGMLWGETPSNTLSKLMHKDAKSVAKISQKLNDLRAEFSDVGVSRTIISSSGAPGTKPAPSGNAHAQTWQSKDNNNNNNNPGL